MLFPTTIVGSFPQPEWLIDREKLAGRFPPRVRAKELWRIPPQYLEQAQNDATLIAIRAQEDAGLDIVSEMFSAIRRVNAEGTAVLLVEQNVAMALRVAHRAYVLEEGRVAAEGAPDELMQRDEIRRAYLGT